MRCKLTYLSKTLSKVTSKFSQYSPLSSIIVDNFVDFQTITPLVYTLKIRIIDSAYRKTLGNHDFWDVVCFPISGFWDMRKMTLWAFQDFVFIARPAPWVQIDMLSGSARGKLVDG